MADKDIDFEELDRAIGALMEKQAGEEEAVEALAKNANPDNLDDIAADLVAKLEEDENVANLAQAGAITDVEVDEIDQVTKDQFVPETSGVEIKVKPRVPVGFEESVKTSAEPVISRPVKVPVPDDLLGKTVSVKPPEEESFEAKVGFTPETPKSQPTVLNAPKPELSPAREASKTTELKPEVKPELRSEPKLEPELTAKPVSEFRKSHIPHRRGKYIDFVTASAAKATKVTRLKELSAQERQARAAEINSRQSRKNSRISDFAPKPVTTTRSVDFQVKLPAKADRPATTVTGNIKSDKTTVTRSSGETMTVKQHTVELVSKPELELKSKPVTAPSQESWPKSENPTMGAEFDKAESKIEAQSTKGLSNESEVVSTKASPFIPEAKVKKRPLGQPEPLLQSPSVTMHVPDRISTYDAGEQTALYRAELHTVADEDRKSSAGWVILLLVIGLIIAGLVYFFWGDIQALLR